MNTVFFDLDGTLTDSAPGIIAGVEYAMNKCGYKPPEDRTILFSFLGPPLKEQFASFLNVGGKEAEQLVGAYREYYSMTGLYENRPYDGVRELLSDLKNSGVKIALTTSKPESFAGKILSHFQLDGYFDKIGGALMQERRTKEEVVSYVMDSLSMTPTQDIFMVGDRKYDVNSANAAGLTSVGVLYGYGSREELEACSPAFLAGTVEDLRQLLLSHT